MTPQGYFTTPRSLTHHVSYQALTHKQKHLLSIILNNCVYREQDFNVHHNLIRLMPGQLSISIRKLLEFSNKGINDKKEILTKSFVERTLNLFHKLHFLKKEVVHNRLLLTITIEGYSNKKSGTVAGQSETDSKHFTKSIAKPKKSTICGSFLKTGESTFSPKMGQSRDINEEESSSLNTKETLTNIHSVSFPLDEGLEEKIKGFAEYAASKGHVFKTQDLHSWFKRYESSDIFEHFSMMLEQISRGMIIRTTLGAWMQSALKRNYIRKAKEIQLYREYALELKERGWETLEVKDRYAVDTQSGKDFIFDNLNCLKLLNDEFKNVMIHNVVQDFATQLSMELNKVYEAFAKELGEKISHNIDYQHYHKNYDILSEICQNNLTLIKNGKVKILSSGKFIEKDLTKISREDLEEDFSRSIAEMKQIFSVMDEKVNEKRFCEKEIYAYAS